ncbi:hypothetical protein DV515_00015667 [Chloebia gouldiae]|uniref:Uncharacterized protein n=1 Tax=Chloebia gouldiae TaxID=44316 RepID=A0A3L8RUQ9_CHLGU|nr:hypothetical protein DV515_00015667 [Chloebia gouldiae]
MKSRNLSDRVLTSASSGFPLEVPPGMKAALPKEPAQNTNRLALAEVSDGEGEGGAHAATQAHLQMFWEALGGKRSP